MLSTLEGMSWVIKRVTRVVIPVTRLVYRSDGRVQRLVHGIRGRFIIFSDS